VSTASARKQPRAWRLLRRPSRARAKKDALGHASAEPATSVAASAAPSFGAQSSEESEKAQPAETQGAHAATDVQ
jgi:hypothetical protein